MKPADLDALLSIADDSKLCDAVFCRFADFNKQIDVDSYTEEERIVTLVWHAAGIIGNGGFQYLFEGEFTGDPGFVYAAAAFKTIGASESYAAFQRALSLFGGHYPADREQRIEAYLRVPKDQRDAIEKQFYDDEKSMHSGLARYIRGRRERFHQLLSSPPSTWKRLRRFFR